MKDTDFPFFHNLFHGSSLKPEVIGGANNGLIFPLGPSPSPKGNNLFQNPFLNFDQNLLLNVSNFGHFTTQGSSPSPLLGLSNTSNIESFHESYTNNVGVVSSKDLNIANVFNSLPLAPPSHNGILHGLPSTKPFWDSNQSSIHQAPGQPPMPTYSSSLNFRDLGSTKANTNLPDPDDDIHVSCITTPDQKGQQQKRVAGQKKRKRMHIMRKASKGAQKKSNVVKGQWTPQEDR